MAPNLPSLKPGDLVAGRFRVVEMIGSGGFSVVYRAHQEGMNRFVALKVLKPTASNDAKIVERFRREALYASHLSHPNTITLFDYGTTDNNLCYIAMEYLNGMDLSAVVQKHVPMDLKRVWKILVQSCRSLAEAHRLGLVHRDLKPENIFLCQREEGEFVKVLDFGVSKAISSFGDAGPATLAPLTQEGTVFGTPLYMAPEQAMAESITPAVDVYALGHIAYEMITGYAAYDGSNNAMDVMLRQINDPPLALPEPWNETPFNQLITHCTQKDPTHRIPNSTALLDILLDEDFEPYFDPSERPATLTTLTRTPAITNTQETQPLLDREEFEEVYRWELDIIEDAFQEAKSEQDVRLVMVRGKPGTGRSNLIRAFTAKAIARPGVTVLHRAQDADADVGLETELSILTGTPLAGKGVDEVKRILRGLYGEEDDFSRDADELGTDSRPLGTLSAIRDTMLQRIGKPFRKKTESTTLVWAIENLERLDTLTLAFLDRFFRDLHSHPAPVLILATVYPEDLKRRSGLVRYVQSLMQAQKPIARQLSLVPPDEKKADDDTAVLDKIPKDIAPDGSYLGFPDSEPETWDDEDEYPDDATDRIVAPATAELGEAFDRIMGYLAQLGDEVPLDLWKLVYARILDTDLVRVVDTIMSQADRFGIVHRSDETIRFAKPGFAEMLREVFEDLPESEDAHRQLAEIMEGYYRSPNHQNIKTIANHWRLAGRPVRAVQLLFDAGQTAYQGLDLDAAREYYLQIQKILEIEAQRIMQTGGVLPFEMTQLWLRLGEVHGALGEHGAAEDALNKSLQEADVNDKKIYARAHKLLGDLAATQERYTDALKYYEKGRDGYRQLGQARPFVAITAEMGRCALQQSRAGLAEDLSRQALEMASKLKDDRLVSRIERNLGQVLVRRGRFLEAIEHLEASMAGFEAAGREFEVIENLGELGNAAYASGKFVDAREHFIRSIALSSSLHVGTPHQAHLGLARTLAALGNLGQAEAHMAEALAHSGTTNELSKMAEVHLYLGDLFLARSDHAKAKGHYDRVIELAKSVGQIRFGIVGLVRHAYVAFDEGDETEVYARLTEAMNQAQSVRDQESELQIRAHIIYTQLLTHGFRARGDTFSSLLNSSDELNLNKAAVLCYLFKADVAAARGEHSEARELLRYAQIGAAQIGDFAMVIPIARRSYLIQRQQEQLGDPHLGAGYAIGALIPPEVGSRRFKELPEAVE